MPILTNSGTVIGGAVIFDRSEVLGTSKGDKMNLYLDFTRSGAETVTLSVAVKSEVVSDYHYVSYLDTSNIVKQQPVVLNATGKYIVPVTVGKDVEEIKIEQTGLTSSTLSVNYGLDNFYA
jgi:hypothetical protein